LLSRSDLVDDLGTIVEILDRWLNDYSDPREEILEALENAFEEGYVLGAFMGERLVGMCVLSKMELDTFFPRFHLSYIAADDSFEGRGIATLLIERAIELTNGQVSLHVERDNRKAIRLYQKMGFDIKYHRMQYMAKGAK
jgi:threonine synthase